ncbi:TetR/AcrR family transcriptional regulator [Limosilactobacillus reuteri]|uniref:TetR/AcrR family transcriptional regulator n=1 Tax=Limosilactobacillus reuteri TaxID=1598 RepID=UPI001E3F476C|nr:TetR/AcrR family transcriptional regulator [Limosilactobacillus reuteri]MCC4381315.1 TetR/AcrR family transcriptional regulator [Limosilactobacillus reuteri]
MNDKIEEKIIKATINFIRTNGYQTVSLRKISQAAGVTTGAFYKRFKNKDVLFYRTALILSQQFVTKFAINNEVSVFDQLLQIAQQFCEEFQKQPQVMDFLFFNPTIIQVYQTENDDFNFLKEIKHLAQQVNPGILNDRQFFEQLWSFIQGYSLLIKNGVTTYDPQVVKVTLSQMVGEK